MRANKKQHSRWRIAAAFLQKFPANRRVLQKQVSAFFLLHTECGKRTMEASSSDAPEWEPLNGKRAFWKGSNKNGLNGVFVRKTLFVSFCNGQGQVQVCVCSPFPNSAVFPALWFSIRTVGQNFSIRRVFNGGPVECTYNFSSISTHLL